MSEEIKDYVIIPSDQAKNIFRDYMIILVPYMNRLLVVSQNQVSEVMEIVKSTGFVQKEYDEQAQEQAEKIFDSCNYSDVDRVIVLDYKQPESVPELDNKQVLKIIARKFHENNPEMPKPKHADFRNNQKAFARKTAVHYNSHKFTGNRRVMK
jgi:hypothetical protein